MSTNSSNEKITFYGAIDGLAIEHMVRFGPHNMKVKHFHPEYEIFYILEGQRVFFFDNRVFIASKGDLVIIDSNLIHMTRSTGSSDLGHNRIILYLTPDKVRSFEERYPSLRISYFLHNHYGLYHLRKEEARHFMDFYYLFKREFQEKRPNYTLAIELAAASLFIRFLRDLRKNPADASAISSDPRHRQVYSLADYLSEHYMEDISLDRLSNRFFLSKYYLCRSFREVTGYNIREYINILRVRHAQSMLEDNQYSVSEIAEKIGYHSTTNFERNFKSYMNMSPLQYRKHRNVYVSGVMPVVDHLE